VVTVTTLFIKLFFWKLSKELPKTTRFAKATGLVGTVGKLLLFEYSGDINVKLLPLSVAVNLPAVPSLTIVLYVAVLSKRNLILG
jgi:hypothetical protein